MKFKILMMLGGAGLAALAWRQFSRNSVKMTTHVTDAYAEDRQLNRMIADVSMDETSAYMENPSPS